MYEQEFHSFMAWSMKPCLLGLDITVNNSYHTNSSWAISKGTFTLTDFSLLSAGRTFMFFIISINGTVL